MFVITVWFEVNASSQEEFAAALRQQADNSLTREADCLRFDVCRDPSRNEWFFLYEIYRDKAAFDRHLQSEHFKSFDASAAQMVVSKEVKALDLMHVAGEE
ncbi:MAG: antibiotic biosynthesis monooxygenase [marine bacterium B5-7]|nr:MAG: antibiotic biosynthesis monooxygenase [marine bacterium B5-7]